MALRETFIGRPATGLDLMNSIKSELVSAGWTLLSEGTDAGNNNYKFLRTAAYTMPDNTDAASAVLKMVNPAATNHVDIQMGQDYDATNIALVTPATSVRRLAYSYQSALNYRMWSCEHWFFLLHTDSGNVLQNYGSTFQYVSAAGVLLPPPGIPTKPTYKAVFVLSPYDTAGTSESTGTSLFIYTGSINYGNAFIINPSTGGEVRGNHIYRSEVHDKYNGHPDNPALLFPTYIQQGTSPNILGRVNYSLISTLITADTQQTIDTETWKALFSGYSNYGTLWLRIA